MPHVDNVFTTDYLDGAVEKMRAVLRDLRTVVDQGTANEVRESAKLKLTDAARVFSELSREYDELLGVVQELREKLADSQEWQRRYRLLQGTIEDVVRGIVDSEELRALAREYATKTFDPGDLQ